MNIKLISFFLVYLDTANLRIYSYPLNISESNFNCYYNIDFNVFNVTNTLLSLLRIHEDFTNADHTQRLLSMLHLHMSELFTRICKSFEDIEKINIAIINKTETNTIQQILQDLITEEIDNLKNTAFNNTIYSNSTISIQDKNDNLEYNVVEELLLDFKENWSVLTRNTLGSIITSVLTDKEEPGYSYDTDNKSRFMSLEPYISSAESNFKGDTRRTFHSLSKFHSMRSQINDYPFLASIHIMSKFLCSGSIISKDMVITAASCLQIVHNNTISRNNPRSIFVRVGSKYSKHAGDLIPIVQVIFHPKYDNLTLEHNLVIVRLIEPFKYSKKKNIMRIQYDKVAEPLNDAVNEMTILGWGSKYSNKTKNGRVKMPDLFIYDTTDCQELYSRYYVTETNFCAGLIQRSGAACVGDVGDAAVSSDELVGIISFGPSVCQLANAPTVFTKIGYYADWIDQVISQKSALRENIFHTISYKPPNIHIVPDFANPSNSVTKDRIQVNASAFPEEMNILKKVINEFVMSNTTILDYILNGDEDNEPEPLAYTSYFDPIRLEKIILEREYLENEGLDSLESKFMEKLPFHTNFLGINSKESMKPTMRPTLVTIMDGNEKTGARSSQSEELSESEHSSDRVSFYRRRGV